MRLVLISRTAQYALRAMALLAARDGHDHDHEGRVTIKQLAAAVGAPQPYLGRIVMTLVEAHLVDARRGPGGGLRLARDAARISLEEIIACFDGDRLFDECAMGLPGCSCLTHKCPLHDDWEGIRGKIRSWWRGRMLADFDPAQIELCLAERAGLAEDDPSAFSLSPAVLPDEDY